MCKSFPTSSYLTIRVVRIPQLEVALHASSSGLNTDAGHLGAEATRVQFEQAWHELNLAVERIQQVSGFQNFLGEPDFDDIIGVVQPGVALIYLIATSEV